MIERDVDPHRSAIDQLQNAAIGGIVNREGIAIWAAQQCKLRRRGSRRRSIRRRWFDHQPVTAQCRQRKAVFAWRHRVDIAGPIGNRLTRNDGGRPRRHPVIGEDPRRSSGQRIDQRDAHAAHRLAIFAVEHDAIGIGEHVDLRRGNSAAPAAGGDGNGDIFTLAQAQPAITLYGLRRNGLGLDRAHEGTAVDSGFINGENFAVAALVGDRGNQAIARGGIEIGRGRRQAEEQHFADADRAGLGQRGDRGAGGGAARDHDRGATAGCGAISVVLAAA